VVNDGEWLISINQGQHL